VELDDGAQELLDGANELTDHNDELMDGAKQMVDAVFDAANEKLTESQAAFSALGVEIRPLTTENYGEEIDRLQSELLEKVDDGTMGFTPAVQLAYLKKKEQQQMVDAIDFTQCTPSLSQAIRMKKLSEAGNLTLEEMEGILGEVKQKEMDRVVFKNEQLYRFFPASYTSERMRREILEILKIWRASNWD